MRPDFLFQLPLASGQVERRIADVKTISLGVPSYYKPGAGGKRGVEIRDKEVPGEYKRTAAKMDRSLGHDNGQGPVTRRLTEYGGVLSALADTVRGLRRCTTLLTSWPQPG